MKFTLCENNNGMEVNIAIAVRNRLGDTVAFNFRRTFTGQMENRRDPLSTARRDVISRYTFGKYLMRNTLGASKVPQRPRCKGAPGLFFQYEWWCMDAGSSNGGSVKGSIVAPSPGERNPLAPQGRASWNITAEQQTAFCRLYTVNFMPDFLPTPPNPPPPPSLLTSQASLDVVTRREHRDSKCR